MKPDKTVLKETGIMLVGTLILCGVMVGAFAVFQRRFDYTVVTGALLGGLSSVLSFFLMGLTIQRAVTKEPDDAKKLIQLSYHLRRIALFGVLFVGVYLGVKKQGYFHWLAVLLSVLFPRVTILLRSVFLKKQEPDQGGDAES